MGVRDCFSRVSTNLIGVNGRVNCHVALRELEMSLRRLKMMTIGK